MATLGHIFKGRRRVTGTPHGNRVAVTTSGPCPRRSRCPQTTTATPALLLNRARLPHGKRVELHPYSGGSHSGNLTQDGRWEYTWDAENRLVRLVAGTAAGPQQRLESEYDAQGRRLGKKGWDNPAGTGTPVQQQRFVYDGWNLIAILDAQFAIHQSFVWGLDLSGSLQGAGGVGGLLWLNDATHGTHFAAYDGNGNVVALVQATDGTESARYEYGPFGEPIRGEGAVAEANPFRFSTKFTDDETDLLYYGYRYYNASTGRWPNRDPIGEQGGLNLYGMVGNNPIDFVDAFGLWRSIPNGGQHDTLTRNSLNTALAGIRNPPNEKCKKKMAKTLVDANVGQDSGEGKNDFPRHFNRNHFATETEQEVQQRRTAARDAYAQYLQQEEVLFSFIPECWARLEALV